MIVNASAAPNTGGFENRATDPARSGKETTNTHGQNNGGFETRVTPAETGTH